VVVDDQGKDVAEWESVFQMSDGCIVFLEAKYRMTLVRIYLICHEDITYKTIKRHISTSSRSGCLEERSGNTVLGRIFLR